MKRLFIDMDLLLELSSDDTRGEGESYLNTETGELSYVPINILETLRSNSSISDLEEWEKELVHEAKLIIEDVEEVYLYIPVVEEQLITSIKIEYANSLSDLALKEKLLSILRVDCNSQNYNNTLMKYGDIDSFYDYKDLKIYEYLINWFLLNNIELIEE
jgi:hypothetical protein